MPVSLATQQGKEFALLQLGKRREKNRDKEKPGSETPFGPWFSYCISCGEEADRKYDRSSLLYFKMKDLCPECQAMKDLGWLE